MQQGVYSFSYNAHNQILAFLDPETMENILVHLHHQYLHLP